MSLHLCLRMMVAGILCNHFDAVYVYSVLCKQSSVKLAFLTLKWCLPIRCAVVHQPVVIHSMFIDLVDVWRSQPRGKCK